MNSKAEELTSAQQRSLYEICWKFEQALNDRQEVKLDQFVAQCVDVDPQIVISELQEIQKERLEQLSKSNSQVSIPSDERYEMLEEIARGGAAAVWRVRDRHLHRETAIKFLLDSQNNHSMRKRLESEARLCARLVHPGIVPIHELSSFSDGRPFVSMKLVKGHTLLQLMDSDRPISTSHAIDIFAKVCEAMGYAHSQRIMHRDLKPSNIMVGAFGEVQIMDWGLGKQLDDESEQSSDMSFGSEQTTSRLSSEDTQRLFSKSETYIEETLVGSVLGTIAYMSPEQACGRINFIDCRSDVFSLGAILCRILTGLPPYHNADQNRLLEDAQTGNLQDAISRLRQSKESCLAQLAITCMSINPNNRPRDAQELLTRLEQIRKQHNQRKRILITILIALPLVLVAAFAAVTVERLFPPAVIESAYEVPIEELKIEHVLSLADASQYEAAQRQYRRFVSANPTDHYARFRFGVTLLNNNEFNAAEKIFQEAISLSPSTPDYWLTLGISKFWQGRVQEALDDLERFRASSNQDPRALKSIEEKIADFHVHFRCAELLQTVPLHELFETKSSQELCNLARACELLGMISEAIQFYDRAIEVESNPRHKNVIRDSATAHFVCRTLKRAGLSIDSRNQLVSAFCRWIKDELEFAIDLKAETNVTVDALKQAHQDLLNHLKSSVKKSFVQKAMKNKNIDSDIRKNLSQLVEQVNAAKLSD